MIYKDLEGYGKQLKKLPVKDWRIVAQFNKIIKNYLKMCKLKEKL